MDDGGMGEIEGLTGWNGQSEKACNEYHFLCPLDHRNIDHLTVEHSYTTAPPFRIQRGLDHMHGMVNFFLRRSVDLMNDPYLGRMDGSFPIESELLHPFGIFPESLMVLHISENSVQGLYSRRLGRHHQPAPGKEDLIPIPGPLGSDIPGEILTTEGQRGHPGR